MTIKHRRHLGLSGVALTGARNNKHDTKALTAVRDQLDGTLDEDGFLLGAPFSWVTIAVRYGLVGASEPSYQAINKKYDDLPMSIEVDAHRLVGLDLEALTAVFREAVLVALIHAGRKYSRPTTRLEAILNDELRQGKQ